MDFSRVKRPLVMCCGCFDLLHIGHVRHLQAAWQLGETLVVLVTADKHVCKPGRPVFPERVRAEMLAALWCVDAVVINRYPTAAPLIRHLKPQLYVKGKEYAGKETPRLREEIEALDSVGGRMVFTDTEGPHTTDVVDVICKCHTLQLS